MPPARISIPTEENTLPIPPEDTQDDSNSKIYIDLSDYNNDERVKVYTEIKSLLDVPSGMPPVSKITEAVLQYGLGA